MNRIFQIPIPDAEDIAEIVRKVIREELQLFKQGSFTQPDEFIDQNTVCKILGISHPTARMYRREGYLKSYRIGSTIRFKKSEVEKALKDIHYIKHSRKTL